MVPATMTSARSARPIRTLRNGSLTAAHHADPGDGVPTRIDDYQNGDQALVRSSLLSHWSRISSPFAM